MGITVSRAELEELFGETLQEVTRRVGGVRLRPGGAPPEDEVCTVYVHFDRGTRSSLCLCADKSMFIRVTQNMMRREKITNQDMEDFSKEYFNVVCGHIAARLFRTKRAAYRFSIPGFCPGRYQPEDHTEYLTLHYAGDQNERAQLFHLVPLKAGADPDAGFVLDDGKG